MHATPAGDEPLGFHATAAFFTLLGTVGVGIDLGVVLLVERLVRLAATVVG